jgi:hypothetical protein
VPDTFVTGSRNGEIGVPIVVHVNPSNSRSTDVIVDIHSMNLVVCLDKDGGLESGIQIMGASFGSQMVYIGPP